MKDDNDLLNNALDSAEATIIEDRDPVDAPAQEVVEDKPIKIEGAPEDEKVEQAKEPVLDQVAETETTDQPGPQIASEPEIAAPVFWSNEQKALWTEATPALKQVIAARELQLQQHISRFANQAKKAETYEQRFYSDFETPEAAERHKAELRLQGLKDPIDELHRARDWDRLFKADPATAIYDLAAKNNLQIQIMGEAQESFTQESNDPRYQKLESKLTQLETEREQEREQAKQAQLAQEVNTFKQGTDETGQPIAPFAAMYAPQIDQAYQQIMAIAEEQGNFLSVIEGLKHAYSYVKAEVEKIHGKPTAPKAKDPQKEIEQAKRAQAAATSTSGAPTSGVNSKPRLKGNDFNEKIESAFDIAYARASSAR
jgi:hypothetical protein